MKIVKFIYNLSVLNLLESIFCQFIREGLELLSNKSYTKILLLFYVKNFLKSNGLNT